MSNIPGIQGMNVSDFPSLDNAPILEITNLTELGANSLRDHWKDTNNARIIVPAVGGHLNMSESLTTSTANEAISGNVIILGQLAPKGGFHIRFDENAVNRKLANLGAYVQVMFLSSRMGSNNFAANSASTNTASCHHVIWDHLSSAYGQDENMTVYESGGQITAQWCLSTRGVVGHSKALYLSSGAGATTQQRLDMDAVAAHHNLFDTCNDRMALFGSNGATCINNLTHNAYNYYMGFNQGQHIDFIANRLKNGPQNGSMSSRLFQWRDTASSGVLNRDPSVFVQDNVSDHGHADGDADQWDAVHDDSYVALPTSMKRTSKLSDAIKYPDYDVLKIHRIADVEQIILQDAGNSRFINEDGRWERYRHALDQIAIDNYVNNVGAQPTVATALSELNANTETPIAQYATTNSMSDKWLAHHGITGTETEMLWGNDLDPTYKNFWCFAFGLKPIPLNN